MPFPGAVYKGFAQKINLVEKMKYYRNIVLLQTILIASALLLKDILYTAGIEIALANVMADSFFLLIAGIYILVLWNMIRRFTTHKTLTTFLFIFLMGAYVLALVTVNPVHNFFPDEASRRPYLFIIHFILFSIEAIVIYYSIYDIFSDNRLSIEKIWGSACIYLMIGICFGSLYDLICIMNPGCMGVPIPLGLGSYMDCIAFSMTIIGGHEAYPDAIPLILKIGVIEAVWANLFVVLLVGRLLGQSGH